RRARFRSGRVLGGRGAAPSLVDVRPPRWYRRAGARAARPGSPAQLLTRRNRRPLLPDERGGRLLEDHRLRAQPRRRSHRALHRPGVVVPVDEGEMSAMTILEGRAMKNSRHTFSFLTLLAGLALASLAAGGCSASSEATADGGSSQTPLF